MTTEPADRVHIVPGNFADPRVLDLLREHLAGMHGNSPPGSVYALGAAALQAPDVAFFTAWRAEALLGCAALKHLDATGGELKSIEPALALYRKRGFQNGPVFGDYLATDFNQFLHLDL